MNSAPRLLAIVSKSKEAICESVAARTPVLKSMIVFPVPLKLVSSAPRIVYRAMAHPIRQAQNWSDWVWSCRRR